MKKSDLKTLVIYISKFGNVSKKFAATFLIKIFEKNNIFKLPNNKQKRIISNLLDYFESIIIIKDEYGHRVLKQSHNITSKEIFEHLQDKTKDLKYIFDTKIHLI